MASIPHAVYGRVRRTPSQPWTITASASAAGGDPCGETGADLQSGQSLRHVYYAPLGPGESGPSLAASLGPDTPTEAAQPSAELGRW